MRKLYSASLILLFLFSCSSKVAEQTNIPTISFENEGEAFKEEDLICEFIPLETSSDCLIKKIAQIQFVDNRIFIFDSANHLFYVFDTNGKFITQIGNYGEGPGEYVLPTQFYINKAKGTITIDDIGKQTIMHYSLKDYQYLNTQKTFKHIYSTLLADGNIVWYYFTGFDTGKGEKHYLMTTNSELKNKQYIYQANFTSPFDLISGSVFHQFEGKMFFHTFFDPIVWEVTSKNSKPAYNISLGKHKFPPLEWLKQEADGSWNYTVSLPNSEYVYAYNLMENSTHIHILYYIKKSIYLGFYNKKTKESQKYTYPQFITYAAINGGMSEILGTYNDYFISYLSPDILKRHSVQRDDLRLLSEKSSEEDNPILCLFKFRE